MLWAFLLEGRWEDGEDVMATTLNQCDIISGGLWSGRRLIFSLQHQSFHARSFLPPHPVTERHPHFPRCSRISSVSPFFLLKAPHLNSSGLTLTRHCCRRIYQCALSSIFYLPAHQGLLFPSSPLTFIGLKNSGWILYLYYVYFSMHPLSPKVDVAAPLVLLSFTVGCAHLLPRQKFSPPPLVFKCCQWTSPFSSPAFFFFFKPTSSLLLFLHPPLVSPIHF